MYFKGYFMSKYPWEEWNPEKNINPFLVDCLAAVKQYQSICCSILELHIKVWKVNKCQIFSMTILVTKIREEVVPNKIYCK